MSRKDTKAGPYGLDRKGKPTTNRKGTPASINTTDERAEALVKGTKDSRGQ